MDPPSEPLGTALAVVVSVVMFVCSTQVRRETLRLLLKGLCCCSTLVGCRYTEAPPHLPRISGPLYGSRALLRCLAGLTFFFFDLKVCFLILFVCTKVQMFRNGGYNKPTVLKMTECGYA